MGDLFLLHEVARLPLPGDNVAVAVRRLEAGTAIGQPERGRIVLDFTVLEGHRFVVEPIAAGAPLLSWGLPFGYALHDLAPGAYVCNAAMLEALAGRSLDAALPAEPNFVDEIHTYQLDEARVAAARQSLPHRERRTFAGYRRPGSRGVGTRNYIILVGVTAASAGFVRRLEARCKTLALPANVDGIVAVAHTEGSEADANNEELVLRCLAGFIVHPNVAAALVVDNGAGGVTNERLRAFMMEKGYPLDCVNARFLELERDFGWHLEHAAAIVQEWIEPAAAAVRTEEPLAALKLGLQCGGSDAFSGISANPLLGRLAREVVRYGGSANLAETDELIGAEPYVLQKVRNVATARRFLATIERFKERVAWHGETAEANPSGGNKYRGLYNITLKSIGAAMKKHPDTRLDEVIEYAEPMRRPGYIFMDSPGNDLESIAGQVAAGCNMILFTTGNGSVTNFPFVPTLKIVTTTARYQLLNGEMDINAGAYLDGAPMGELGAEALELTVATASGRRSAGERAGHAQVQLWRDWRQRSAAELPRLQGRRPPEAATLRPPLPQGAASLAGVQARVIEEAEGPRARRVGLVLPTSLCAAQIAQMAAERLNRELGGGSVSRFVALAHTEGCGASAAAKELYVQTALGYVRHPWVAHCLLLEHGCEVTHNDYMRHALAGAGGDPAEYGWASIQMDGGIEAVLHKVAAWFRRRLEAAPAPVYRAAPLAERRLALLSDGPLPDAAADGLGRLAAEWAQRGAVVVPAGDALLAAEPFVAHCGAAAEATLAYAARAEGPGLHIMEMPTSQRLEVMAGLGASGADLLLAHVGAMPLAGHPMLPLVQVSAAPAPAAERGGDIDMALVGSPERWLRPLALRLAAALEGAEPTAAEMQGNLVFQVTRGWLGVSM